MLKYLFLIMTSTLTITSHSQTFYELAITSIDGENINLSDFKDRYVLVVNVASFCGFTKQYSDLQTLHKSYPNLTIIGVPCNQFGFQEPGGAQAIQSFCQNKYNIEFILTEKTKVKGKEKHPLYAWLTDKNLNKKDNYSVSWNFNKFLIGKDGSLLAHFGSNVSPLDQQITTYLKQ